MEEIFNRRSIRKFKIRDIEQEKVDKLIKAAMQAPSAGNQQPWEFLVINNPKLLYELLNNSPYEGMVENPSIAIVLLTNLVEARFPEYWQQDMAAATQNIMLEAVNLGLGTVWLGAAADERRTIFLKEALSLPEEIKPFSIVAVGYPDFGQENLFVDRFVSSKVKYNKYE